QCPGGIDSDILLRNSKLDRMNSQEKKNNSSHKQIFKGSHERRPALQFYKLYSPVIRLCSGSSGFINRLAFTFAICLHPAFVYAEFFGQRGFYRSRPPL